jgi:nitrogen fixation protein FixH
MSMARVEDPGMTKRDRLIPWYIVAFFVVVAILDGIFVYLATSTHTGVVTERAYDKGIAYNETVAAAEAQKALGWQGDITLAADRTLTFSLLGAEGQPLSGATVKAEFMRPTQAGMDFAVELSETAAGQYSASVDFPAEGLWDVRVFALEGEQDFQHHQRLVVKTP